MNESDDALDLIILVATLAVFSVVMITCSIPLFKGEVGGFDVLIEKSAPPTVSEIEPDPPSFTTRDALLMVLIADRNTPQPRQLRINMGGTPTTVTIDENLFGARADALNLVNSAIPARQDVKLELFAGPDGMRFWDIHP
ncbi:hypothetical protein [Paenibacillus xylaniclasticus]|uniref:hypothetical protein n=1 Tax=Paenibacillus xylaniclasticus TaxID=588083 RepID=UPI000FD94949|nr:MULTISPECIES: hypothetical protein [Paenibacillus]GFN30938.1 hypothetical protein PCURB6_11980 [Paenibacillus curdlanolyticus]